MARNQGRHRIARRTKIATALLGLSLAVGGLVVATTTGDPDKASADEADLSQFVDITTVQPNVNKPEPGDNASTGSFTVDCGKNENGHFNPDNFIAQPGVRNGAQHLHDYVGNLSTNADSNNDSLLGAGTTCENGDESTYYWPVVRIDTAEEGEEQQGEQNQNNQQGQNQQQNNQQGQNQQQNNQQGQNQNNNEQNQNDQQGQQNQNNQDQQGDNQNQDRQQRDGQQQGRNQGGGGQPQGDRDQNRDGDQNRQQQGRGDNQDQNNQQGQNNDQNNQQEQNNQNQNNQNNNEQNQNDNNQNDNNQNNNNQNNDNQNNDNQNNNNQEQEQAELEAPNADNELAGNDGEIQRPAVVDITFKGSAVEKVKEMPKFLRILTGDAKVTTNGEANARESWTCTGFEDRIIKQYPICPEGSNVKRVHTFPSCLDGNNIDSENHRDHIKFPNENGECADGLTAVPELTISLTYNIPRAIQVAGQYKVDSFPEEDHNPFSDHNDFANVMSDQIMDRLVDCINEGRKCRE